MVILNRVGRAGLTEKVTPERRHQVQRPEVRACLNVQELVRKPVWLEQSKEGNLTGEGLHLVGP